jgi:hypothetical protein
MLTFDATQLEAGSYSAVLVVNSNDPVNFEKMISVRLRVDPSVSVADNAAGPLSFTLGQNQPNPFREATRIEFTLAAPSEVQLRVYDLQGRLVKQVASGAYASGRHNLVWDAKDEHGRHVASGVYLYVLETPTLKTARKLLLMR